MESRGGKREEGNEWKEGGEGKEGEERSFYPDLVPTILKGLVKVLA